MNITAKPTAELGSLPSLVMLAEKLVLLGCDDA
jgi:hypothetical protein